MELPGRFWVNSKCCVRDFQEMVIASDAEEDER